MLPPQDDLPEPPCSASERHLLLASDSSMDQSLWLSAHCDLLVKRQEEYLALSRELNSLNEIYNDIRELVGQQEEPLDQVEQLVLQTTERTEVAQAQLQQGSILQRSGLWLRVGLVVLVGTTIGAGAGGVAILIGLKPLAALALGSSCGLLVTGVAAGTRNV